MGLPVVVVPAGGLPVTVATNGFGLPVTAGTTGIAVTVVPDKGLPVVSVGGTGIGGTPPVLSITSPSTDTTPDFVITYPMVAGDTLRFQIQLSGSDWSAPLSDTTRTITAGEDAVDTVNLAGGALPNGTYDARASINGVWSNTVTFTIAAAGVNRGAFMYPYLGV